MSKDKRVWVTVKNVGEHVEASDYIVARAVNGELWYYGAYSSKEFAQTVAEKFDNAVVIH